MGKKFKGPAKKQLTMKKKIYNVLMAITMMLMMTSCGNKVDSLLDKYEEAVDEYVDEVQNNSGDDESMFGNLGAAARLSIKIDNLADELREYEDEMTDEQKERMVDISMRMLEGTTQDYIDVFDDAESLTEEIDDLFEIEEEY